MFRSTASLCLLVPVVLLSCNGGEMLPEAERSASVTQQLLVTTPPPLQTPVPFKQGVVLFPATVKSAWLVMLKDTTTATIYAYGFDVVSNKNLFVLTADPADKASIVNQMELDITRWKVSNRGIDLGNGSTEGIGVKIGPGPRGAMAWAVAYNIQSDWDEANRIFQ